MNFTRPASSAGAGAGNGATPTGGGAPSVLLLDQFSDPGGAQRCLLDLLPGIGERGWRALAGLPGDGPLFSQCEAQGVETARITCGPYGSGHKSVGDAARFLGGTPVLAREIKRLVRRTGASVVYINGPRLLPAVALAGLRKPVVFHAHSYIAPGAMRKMAGAALRRSDAFVIGSSSFVAQPWRKFVAEEQVRVIYNGVAGPEQPVWKPNPGGPRIGCIGRIAPEKGQLEFLQAAGLIGRALPQARFRVYGAVLFSDAAAERYADKIKAAAAGLPVEFAGWAPDVYEALAELDLLLAPSAAHDATPRVIVEAFAAGVPVIAFRSGGIPELIEDGRTGILVDSAAEMAEAAVRLLAGEGAAMSQAARQAWSERFRVDRWRTAVLDTIAAAAGL
jgi:glycosyltransferase involved in cell wall biosynthesis